MTKLKSEMTIFKKQLSLPLAIFVYLSRVVFLFSVFISPTKESAVFSLVSFILTFFVDLCHLISKKESFPSQLSHRITVLICTSSLASCFIGQTLGVLGKYPDYDIVMSLVTGVVGTLFGYYLTLSMKSVENKRDCGFIVSSSLFICGTIIFFREMLEFLSDHLLGTNYTHPEQIGDDHWFFRLFGLGMGVPQQRPLYDINEDMFISLIFSVLTIAVLYIFLRIKYKNSFTEESRKEKFSFKAIPARISDKIFLEIEKVKADTNVVDILWWWIVRSAMLYAFINMENVAEKILIGANLTGAFAVTLMHLVFPKDSLFCKINYRLQSFICIIVFTGSYMSNFIFVFHNLPRFDLFVHFISGAIVVAGGYYAAKTFMNAKTKRDAFLMTLYAFCLSGFVMPFWEVFEFFGDFLFGSANQGFYWGPTDDSFFFKVFGHGTGNTQLYYLFDTVYDELLAFSTTVVACVWLYISLLKGLKQGKSAESKEKITADC